MHLNTMANIKEGDFVSEGDLLGSIGGSGMGIMDKYRPHLHYELKIDGEYVNPIIDNGILEINTSAVQLFPQQIILKHEKF